MKVEDTIDTPAGSAERRTRRVLGNLVSLNGMHGVIACNMSGLEAGEYWSVGNLISVVHDGARLVGQVSDMTTSDQRWRSDDVNTALVKIELSGEIYDEAPGKPV